MFTVRQNTATAAQLSQECSEEALLQLSTPRLLDTTNTSTG